MIRLRDNVRSRKLPIITYFLISLNVFIFLIDTSLPIHKLDSLVVMYGIVPVRLAHPPFTKFYTLFTSMLFSCLVDGFLQESFRVMRRRSVVRWSLSLRISGGYSS